MHNLVVVNPGHFHAALTLRERHPLLSEDVYVYAEEGADLERFLGIVQTFNDRTHQPTCWKLHVYRGIDYLAKLISERRGEIAVIAGKNDGKLDMIHRLHAAGLHVLGDKPWLIDPGQINRVREIVNAPPLAMDIMTERFEVATRVQKALAARPEVFGEFRRSGAEPAISMKSVHHLYKMVNSRPLVRPAWYFDVAVQGTGITDVTTHLVDLVQWITANDAQLDYQRDVDGVTARQWPTAVPLEEFTRITGLTDFPAAVREHVAGDTLHYLCNAALSYRLRGIAVEIEAIWGLVEPRSGGDLHRAVLRGTKADLIVEQGPQSQFLPTLDICPVEPSPGYGEALTHALAALQTVFPGVAYEANDAGYRITIPPALRNTHEQRFAAVLREFLGYVDRSRWPATLGADLLCKYTLLARAAEVV